MESITKTERSPEAKLLKTERSDRRTQKIKENIEMFQKNSYVYGNNLILTILLKHFNIRNTLKDSYLKFCESEKKTPLKDFVEYILSKVPNKTYKITHYNVDYKFYIYDNNVFFNKENEKKFGTFLGEF